MKTKSDQSAEPTKTMCRQGRHVKEEPGKCKECKRESDRRRPKRPSRAKPPGESRSFTGGSHLDEDDVRAIRRSVIERGMPVASVARHYELHEDSVRRIVRGGSWGWVK